MDLHDLTAGYALDALDPDERARYEEHLASCERCRDELQELLAGRRRARPRGRRPDAARVAPRPDPRAGARRAAERRPAAPSDRGAGARVGRRGCGRGRGRARDLVARALPRPRRREQRARRARAIPTRASTRPRTARRTSSSPRPAEAALVVRMLAPAPAGKDYEIWVFENGVPQRAGLFERPGVDDAVAEGRARTDGGGHARARRRRRRADERPALHGRLGVTNPSRSRDGCVPTRSVDSLG